MPADDLRAELIRAIALELTQLGYRPCARIGYLQREDEESLKLVSEEIWRKAREIVGEREFPS